MRGSKYLGTDDIAKKIGVSRTTVLKYIKSGRLKPLASMVGGRKIYLFRPEDVNEAEHVRLTTRRGRPPKQKR